MVPALPPDASKNAATSTLASTARHDASPSSSSMPVTTDALPSSNMVTNNNNSSSNINKLGGGGSSSKPIAGSMSLPEKHMPLSSRGNTPISHSSGPAGPTDALDNMTSAPKGNPSKELQENSLTVGPGLGLVEGPRHAEGVAEVEEENDIASDIQERSLGENDDQNSLQEQGDEQVIQDPVDDQMDLAGSAAAAAVAAATLQQQQQQQQLKQQQQQQQHQPAGSGAAQSTTTEQAVEDLGLQENTVEDEYPQESYTSPHHEWARVLQRRLNKGLTDAQLLARSNSMLASPSILAQSLTKALPRFHPSKDGQPGGTSQERPHQTAEELFDRPAALDPSPVHYQESSKQDVAFPSTLDNLGPANSLLLFAPLDPEQLYGKKPSSAPPPAPSVQPAPTPSVDPLPVAPIAPAMANPAIYTSKDSKMSTLAPAPPITAATSTAIVDTTLVPKQPAVVSNQSSIAPAPSNYQGNTSTTNAIAQDTPGGLLPVAPVVAVPALQVTPTEALILSTLPTAQAPNILGAPTAHALSQSPVPLTRSPIAAQTMTASASTAMPGSTGVASLPPPSGASVTATTPVPANHQLVNYPTSHLLYTPQTQYKANPSKKSRDASVSERKPGAALEEERNAAAGQMSSDDRSPTAKDDTVVPDPTATGLSTSLSTRPRAGSESQVSTHEDTVKDWAIQALSGFADLNLDVSLSIGNPGLQALAHSPAPQVAKIIQSPFEADPSDLERPAIVLRANSYPIERTSSTRRQLQPTASSQAVLETQPTIIENDTSEQTPSSNTGDPPTYGRAPVQGSASGHQGLAISQTPIAIPSGGVTASTAAQAAPLPVAMPAAIPQTQCYQGATFSQSAAYGHLPPIQPIQPIPAPTTLPTTAAPSGSAPTVGPIAIAPTSTPFGHGHRSEHRVGTSVSSLREVTSAPYVSASADRTSFDNHPATRRQGASHSASAPTSTSASTGSGALGVPWLPQSQPLLPPRLDVNLIDVPALAGKQLLPMVPRPLPPLPESQKCFQFGHIAKAIRFWGRVRSNASAFAVMDGKGVTWGSWTWGHVLGRAEMIAKNILEQTQLKPGARVILIYRLSEILEFVAALYGSFLAGVVPVLLNQTQEYSEINYVFTATRTELVLTTEQSHKILHQGVGSKRGPSWPRSVTWWTTDGMGSWAPRDKKEKRPSIRPHELAIIEYTKSASGELKGVATSHRSLLSQCRTLLQSFAFRVPASNQIPEDPLKAKTPTGQSNESSPLSPISPIDHGATAPIPSSSRTTVPPHTLDQCIVASWLESRQQAGLWLTSIMGAFCGNFTVFMDSSITSHPSIYVSALGSLKANIAFGDYQGMRTLLGNLRNSSQAVLSNNPPNLSKLRAFYAHTQSCHPRLHIEFLKELLGPLGMCHDSFKSTTSLDQPLGGKSASTEPDRSTKDESDDNRPTTPTNPAAVSEEMILPRGVIAFISLPEHGGPIIGVRDELGPPKGIEAYDIRKKHRKSSFPPPRSAFSSNTGRQSLITGTAGPNTTSESPLIKLKSSSTSSMTQCVYLLHRGALRVNRIIVLATGQDALRRADEPGTMLVGAAGYPIAKSTILIVDPETMALSLPDEVGEIWFSSSGMPAGYWNLSEHTKEVFHAEPLIVSEDTMVPEVYRAPGCDKMLRTGLLGTLIEGRLVVFGTYDERLKQDAGDPMKPRGLEFEYHHASDVTHTLRSRVLNAGEICVFSCQVNKEYLPVICIEIAKDPSCTNPKARAKTITRTVFDILIDVNGLRSYCIAVWEPNELPRVLSNGRRVLDLALTKRMFELGRIPNMLHIATYTEGVVMNLPQGDDPIGGVWGRDCITKRQQRMGVPAQHLQFASNVTSEEPMDERFSMPLNKFHNITDILMWRTIVQPDEPAYIELDHRGREHKVTSFKKLNHKVTGVATYLEKKHQLKAGDHVILWLSNTVDLIVTLQACWVMGVIAIPLPAPGLWSNTIVIQAQSASVTSLVNLTATTQGHPGSGSPGGQLVGNAIDEERMAMVHAMLHIMEEVKVKAIIGNNYSEDAFKAKSFANQLRTARPQSAVPAAFCGDVTLPPFVNISKASKTNKTLGLISGFIPRKEWLGSSHPAMIFYDLHARPESSSSKRLLKLTHESLTALARNQKLQSNLTTGQPILTCLSVFNGPGFVQTCLAGVYNGSPTLLIHPGDFLSTPTIWMEAVARYSVQNALLTYPMAEHLVSRLEGASALNPIFSLDSLKNLMISFDGRAMRDLNTTIASRLAPFKLAFSAINMTYGTPLDIMTSSRAGTGIGPVRLHVSTRQLRYGIVQPTSEGDDPTGMWLEDSGSVSAYHTIAIVHPETFEICPLNQVGEIWICADSTVNQFYGQTNQAAINAGNYSHLPFNACANYDQRVRYVRTGDLGFLWNSQLYHLQQQQGQQQQGQQQQGISGHHHHHLQQLFVLGSMASSFQVNGLLHFASDIEATVESAHANVATQGCITFKTNNGQVVVVVKVVHQESERLLPMFIPLMHAILEQHQFVPDVIALVGDGVSTSRGHLDGCKPRLHLQTLYQTSKLPTLHVHHCHGNSISQHQLQRRDSTLDTGSRQHHHQQQHTYHDPYAHVEHHGHQLSHSSAQIHAPAMVDEVTYFGQQGVYHHSASDGGATSQPATTGSLLAASPHVPSAVLLAPLTGAHHQYPAHSNGSTVLASAVALAGGMPPSLLYTSTGRPTSLILPSTAPPVGSFGSGPSSAGAVPSGNGGGGSLHAHYPSAPGGGGGVAHLMQFGHGAHSHPRAIGASGRAGSLEDFKPTSSGHYSYYQHQQSLHGGGGSTSNNNNASGDASSINSQRSGHGGHHDNNKKGAAVKNLVKGMNARLTEMRKASLT